MLALTCAALWCRGAVGQPMAMPVLVSQQSRKSVQVIVSIGPVLPCDASENTPLFKGWMAPGRSAVLTANAGCVCFQHTYDDFPGVNWSTAQMVCRRGCRKGRPCSPDPNQTIWLPIPSSGGYL
jgi:hypothetical protein